MNPEYRECKYCGAKVFYSAAWPGWLNPKGVDSDRCPESPEPRRQHRPEL